MVVDTEVMIMEAGTNMVDQVDTLEEAIEMTGVIEEDFQEILEDKEAIMIEEAEIETSEDKEILMIEEAVTEVSETKEASWIEEVVIEEVALWTEEETVDIREMITGIDIEPYKFN